MAKKIFLFLFVFLILGSGVSIVSAAVSYQNGEAIITGTQKLKDIKNTDYMTISNGICYLKKPIRIREGGTLYVDNNSCKKLNMYAQSMITSYGKLYFKNIIVTSYNPSTKKPIELSRTNYNTRRPDIITRPGATYFRAENTEFSYLGYFYNPRDSHWGVALRYLSSAYIVNSKFHHNYFGFYTFESNNVQIKNSQVYDNLEYGINIHDFSDNVYVYNNTVSKNGNHGIILSKGNLNGRVIKNKISDHTQNAFVKGVVQDYGTHGIVIHLGSDNALVERNELSNNREGIMFAESDNGRINKNIIRSDLEEGIHLRESTGISLTGNQVLDADGPTLFSDNAVDNTYSGNNWGGTSNQIYFRIIYPDGSVFRYRQAGTSDADAKLNELSQMSLENAPDTAAVPGIQARGAPSADADASLTPSDEAPEWSDGEQWKEWEDEQNKEDEEVIEDIESYVDGYDDEKDRNGNNEPPKEKEDNRTGNESKKDEGLNETETAPSDQNKSGNESNENTNHTENKTSSSRIYRGVINPQKQGTLRINIS